MANSDKNIKITPNISQTAQPNVVFTGQGAVPITLKVLDDSFGTLSFEGSAGQLFSINNNLSTGVIFSVNDISGIPQIDVNANGTVRLVPFGGVVGVGTSSPQSTSPGVDITADASNPLTGQLMIKRAGTLDRLRLTCGMHTSNYGFIQAYENSIGGLVLALQPSSGTVGIGVTAPGAKLQIDTTAAATKGLIVKGFTSQSANLQEWQNSGGTVLTTVDSAGKVAIGTTSTTVKLNVQTASNTIGTGLSYYYTSYALTSSATTTYANDFLTYGDRGSSNATLWGMRVAHNGAYTGTTVGTSYTRGALLVQCQDYNEGTGSTFGIKIENTYGSASNAYGLYAENAQVPVGNSFAGYFSAPSAGGTAYGIYAKAENPAGVRSATAGEFYISNSVTSNAYGIKVSNAGAITVGGVYYGCHVSISGATVTGAKAAGFFSDGTYTATFGNGSYSALFNSRVGIGNTAPGGRLQIDTGAADTTGLIVKGFTSQTYNLTEWQASNGTVLAQIASDGTLSVGENARVSASDTGFILANSSTLTFGPGPFIEDARDCGLGRESVGVITVTNASTGGGSLAFTNSSPSGYTANQNNLVLTGSAFQRLSGTAARDITGVAPPSGGSHVDGRMMRIFNVGSFNLTLKHNSASSTAANRFFCVQSADVVIATNDFAELIYDSTNNGSGAAGWRVA